MANGHEPVLLQPTIAVLNPQKGETIIDATAGHGGHALKLAQAVGSTGTILLIDQDEEALGFARANLSSTSCRVLSAIGNFREIKQLLLKSGLAQADIILFDFGFNTAQLESGRGFSFQKDEPLVMTFKSHPSEEDITAFDVVNRWSEENLATIIYGFGEERFSRRIARALMVAREHQPIRTSGQLAEIVTSSLPIWARRGRRHPATKTFQAIRMAVNQELGSLESALPQAWEILRPGGRLGVISFHSLEARLVKNYFRDRVQEKSALNLTGRVIKPTRDEIKINPKSRSAELRVIKKK